MHIPETKLKEILVSGEVLSEKEFLKCKEESQRSGVSLVNVLVGRDFLTEEYLTELLQPYFGCTQVDLRKVGLSREVLQLIPDVYAKAKNVVLFEMDAVKKTAKVAMLDPLDLETIDFLQAKLKVWVDAYLTSPDSMRFALRQYKRDIGKEFKQVISENVEKFLSSGQSDSLTQLVESVPIVTILDSIVEHAVVQNASDIHFEPFPTEVLVRYRIDGIMHEILSLSQAILPILVARVKVLANLQIDEHKVPQDGRFRFHSEDGFTVDVRVNVMPVMHGEKVEMRLLKNSSKPLNLDELGLSEKSEKIVAEEIKKPHGMILVTGPTGHGKTTTLYAILHLLNTAAVNITTIEDPIEYEVAKINQTQVNVKAGITFANGLRALLRQNPDIIMVGEIRDSDTVQIAVQAALTGHLVLSSLHTNDAPSALPRLSDMGAPQFLLASTVNLIIAQRLVRKICKMCVESYPMPKDIEESVRQQISLSLGANITPIPQSLYRGKGCKVCGSSGFIGQVGIFEILKVDEFIRPLILKNAPISEIRAQAQKSGMVSMFEDGLDKVQRGVTTIEEILRVVRE